MDDLRIYQIQLSGHIQEAYLTSKSPLQLTLEPCSDATTRLTIHTDQSGLIGMLRHLHGLGLDILLVTTASPEA